MPVEAPGELGTLVLPAAGALGLAVAELAADTTPASVRLLGGDGRPYRSGGSAEALVERWPLAAGQVTLGDLDSLIAAHAFSLNLVMVTNNLREFSRVPGLRTENWVLPG